MASKSKSYYNDETEYARTNGIVYGNVAYDLNTLPNRRQEAERREKQQVRARAYSAAKANKQGISLLSIAGFVTFAVLIVFSLLAKVQLTQISDETAALEVKIQQLGKEEARLKIEYESAFNLTQIEDYATKRLGMVRNSSDNHMFLMTTDSDRAVILDEEMTSGKGVFFDIKGFFSSLMEYL